MSELHDLLFKAKEGDSSCCLSLIDKFQPLLKKYAYKLDYEDAYNDLLLNFIEFISHVKMNDIRNSDDNTLLSYINRSVYHAFISLSKSNSVLKKNSPMSFYEDNDNYNFLWDKYLAEDDEYRQIEYDFLYKVLTKREAEIIIYLFHLSYTVKEISAFYGVSPAAITQAKKNAIKKLKNAYLSEEE